MKLKELQTIANSNYKTLTLANVHYMDYTNGQTRLVPQEEVGAWGWYINTGDDYFTALSDLQHEANNILWQISANAIADVEVNAAYVLMDDENNDIIVNYVVLPVNRPQEIATSRDGKLTVSTTYGDGYIVDYGDNSENWFAEESEAMAEVDEYDNWEE